MKDSTKNITKKNTMEKNTEDKIRLQKRISDSGLCSRRKAEELMERGRVRVNGKVISKMGSKVSLNDRVAVNGKDLPVHDELTIALYKPSGLITSKRETKHKNTIMSLLPAKWQHLKPAGRLDKESEGLIILSTNGDLIQKLTHPKNEHTKTYEVMVKGWVKEKTLFPIQEGHIRLDDYQLNPAKVKILKTTADKKTWLEVELSEGRNRQIRRMLDQVGHPVLYLKRIGVGRLFLGRRPLKEVTKGQFYELSEQDIKKALSSGSPRRSPSRDAAPSKSPSSKKTPPATPPSPTS
jgi:23S rRNA pseudouridine2605 synthase